MAVIGKNNLIIKTNINQYVKLDNLIKNKVKIIKIHLTLKLYFINVDYVY